jgi:hypothetical protein
MLASWRRSFPEGQAPKSKEQMGTVCSPCGR